MSTPLQTLAAILISAAVLAACGAPSDPGATDAAGSAGAASTTSPATGSSGTRDVAHGVSTDPIPATGFITENAPPPPTAEEKNGVMRDADGRPYTYDVLGQTLPAIAGETLDGEAFSTGEISEWTILYVWGVWCGDCRADGPYTADLASRLSADPTLDFMSVHTPASAARADAAYGVFGSVDAYFEDSGFSYPTMIDGDASIRDALKIAWTPSYLLVSPSGVVRGFRTDLSVVGNDDPVSVFLDDVNRVMGETF